MAKKEINFRTAKKTFLTVTLPNDEKILVKSPTKRQMDSLRDLSDDFKAAEENNDSTDSYEALDRLYVSCADLMSRNMQDKKITADDLEDLLDLEDLIVFFDAYVDFVSGLEVNVKN